MREGYLETSPAEAVEPPKGRRTKIAYFTPSDLERFCRAAQGYYEANQAKLDNAGRGNFVWIVDLVRFAVATGLRKAELRHLRWCDVDETSGRLYVRSYRGTRQGRPVAFDTEVGSDRTVSIFPMAADVLEHRTAMRRSENPEEPVFLGPTSRRLGESQINHAFRKARQEAGLSEDLDIHACRHTFASWLLSKGETLYRVSRWPGHSRIGITADTYGHLQETHSEVGRDVFS